MDKLRNNKGFTMIELMVVLGIITIMSGAAIPGFMAWLPRMRVNGCARNLAGNMQWARMKAVSDNNPYFMTFDTANNQYVIYDDDDDSGTFAAGEIVRTVDITAECTGIIFGLPGVSQDPNEDGVGVANKVTFAANADLSNQPTLNFNTKGILSESKTVFMVPSADTTSDRVRAIHTTRAGRTKVLVYDSSSNTWN